MTRMAVDSANGAVYYNEKGQMIVDKKKRTKQYMILPLTILMDTATLPFQGIFLLMTGDYMMKM
jgi:hypothetical protein